MSSFTVDAPSAAPKAKKELTREEEDDLAIKAAEHGVHRVGGDSVSLA
jgi:hypothetical protein